MEKLRKSFIYVAISLSVPQFVAYLFSLSRGAALIIGLALSGYYLLYANYISEGEIAVGFSSFLASSFAFSAAGKILILDDLCKSAQSMGETNSSISGIISPDDVCRGFVENWYTAIMSNPVWNWYFWVFTLVVVIISIYGYRRYSR